MCFTASVKLTSGPRYTSVGRQWHARACKDGLQIWSLPINVAPWQTSPPGQKWAASLVVSRVRAAGIEEDEKDMRKRVTRGRPDAKVRKLMAASSKAQPPGVVKTLTDDKKRKRPVKKRRGKKLTVAESESEAEAEAEAEAARSSKRRVPRACKNKNKQ
eukprot:jgi/Tetstr1/464775/TSEL_009521.t1